MYLHVDVESSNYSYFKIVLTLSNRQVPLYKPPLFFVFKGTVCNCKGMLQDLQISRGSAWIKQSTSNTFYSVVTACMFKLWDIIWCLKKCYQPAKPFIDCIFYSLHVPVVLLIMLWFRWMIQLVFFPSTDKWHFNIVWEIGSDSLDILKKGMENGSRVKRNCIGMHAIQLNLFYSLIVLGIVLFHSSKLWFVFFFSFLKFRCVTHEINLF